jgi:AraC-like DNA-binding protein
LDLLQKLIRFGSLFDSEATRHAVNIEMTHDTIRALGSSLDQPNRLECVEATLIGVVLQLRAFSEAEVRVLEVHTHQTDHRDRAALDEIFGCPIYFGSSQEGLVFAREPMLAPLRGANAEVAARIEAYVAETFADGPEASLVAKVQGVVRAQLRASELSQRAAAQALGLGVRALERRLKTAGTSFGSIVEEARRAEAQRLLREHALAIYEIAFCLGYQDVSSFNRAFKRWFGISPRAYRAS